MMSGGLDFRLAKIELDESTILTRNEIVEQEKRVAIIQILQENSFEPIFLEPVPAGPFALRLSLIGNALRFALSDAGMTPLGSFNLPLKAFRRIIRQYLVVCDSYYSALTRGQTMGLQAVDMGRRGLHNDGAEMLTGYLKDRIRMDEGTAKRLFSLLAILHTKDVSTG